MTLESPKSPLSSTAQVEMIKEYDAVQLAKEWGDIYKIDISKDLKGIKTLTKYQCCESGVYFYFPASCEGSGMLYHQLSKFPWYYIGDKWEHNLSLSYCRPNMKLLEIGCGGGEFLLKAVQQGCRCVGLEINPSVNSGNGPVDIEIRKQFLSECAITEKESFDIVCAFQVLEHISDPKDFLNDCIKAAKKDALIILGTPNAESFLKYSHNLLDLPPHHMSGWSRSSYEYLEMLFPIKLVKICYEPLASYHFDYYIETYRSHFSKVKNWKECLFTGWLGRIFKKFLLLGGWRFIRGQCMVAIYRKN